MAMLALTETSSDWYLAAALFAGSEQVYQSLPLPFSHKGQEGNWSITPIAFTALTSLFAGQNSTAVNNLTLVTNGVSTMANCKLANITFGSNATITATVDQIFQCQLIQPILVGILPTLPSASRPLTLTLRSTLLSMVFTSRPATKHKIQVNLPFLPSVAPRYRLPKYLLHYLSLQTVRSVP